MNIFRGGLAILLAMGLVACGSDAEEDNDTSNLPDAGDTTSDESTESDSSNDDDAVTDAGGDEPTESEPTNSDDAVDAGPDTVTDAGPDDTVGDAGRTTDAAVSDDSGATEPVGGDSGATDSGATETSAADSGGGNTSADSGAGDGGAATRCGVPTDVGTFLPPDGTAEGFVIDGERAYVAATSAGVYVVDLSDPASPTDIGQYDFPPGELVFRVASSGNLVAAAMRGNGWALLDVSDIEDIQLLTQEDAVSAEDIALAGDVLYYADGDGVGSYDISDPENPVPLSTDLVLPGNSHQMIVAGDRIYVASLGAGISIVDASDPSDLSELSSLDIGSVGSSHIALAGNTLYAAHLDGVTLVDVSDPEDPVAIGEYTRERAHALSVRGDRLFVFGDDTNSSDVPFLSVVDVSDPANPVDDNAGLNTFEAPVHAAIAGDWLAVSVEDDDSLHLYNACPTP